MFFHRIYSCFSPFNLILNISFQSFLNVVVVVVVADVVFFLLLLLAVVVLQKKTEIRFISQTEQHCNDISNIILGLFMMTSHIWIQLVCSFCSGTTGTVIPSSLRHIKWNLIWFKRRFEKIIRFITNEFYGDDLLDILEYFERSECMEWRNSSYAKKGTLIQTRIKCQKLALFVVFMWNHWAVVIQP